MGKGRFWVFVILLYFVVLNMSFAQDSLSGMQKFGWKLAWYDDFDGMVLDKTKWTIRNDSNVYNNELEYYTPEDVYLENGNLVLRTQKRQFENRHFTSGRVNTRNKFSFQYGYIEIRAKLPETQGIWPAFWMMPQDRIWPPEIDIMECLGQEPNRVYFAYHWGDADDPLQLASNFLSPVAFSSDFHTFALEWTEHEMNWFVDGIPRFQVQREQVSDFADKPFYLIFNTAVGGTWPGRPDRTTVFPQYLLIDYVRVYQKVKSSCSNSLMLSK